MESNQLGDFFKPKKKKKFIEKEPIIIPSISNTIYTDKELDVIEQIETKQNEIRNINRIKKEKNFIKKWNDYYYDYNVKKTHWHAIKIMTDIQNMNKKFDDTLGQAEINDRTSGGNTGLTCLQEATTYINKQKQKFFNTEMSKRLDITISNLPDLAFMESIIN